MFENKVLWRIFGSKRNEVTGEWRKLYNEELNDLYCSPSIVRVTICTSLHLTSIFAAVSEQIILQNKTQACKKVDV